MLHNVNVYQSFTALGTQHQVTDFDLLADTDIFMWVTSTSGRREPVLNAGTNGFTIDFPLAAPNDKHPRITLTEALVAGESLLCWRLTVIEQTHVTNGTTNTQDTDIFSRLDKLTATLLELRAGDNLELLASSSGGTSKTIAGGTVDEARAGFSRLDFADLWIGHEQVVGADLVVECVGNGSASAYIDATFQLRVGSVGLITDPVVQSVKLRAPLLPSGITTSYPVRFRTTYTQASSGLRYAITIDNQSPDGAAGFLDIAVSGNSFVELRRRKWVGF